MMLQFSEIAQSRVFNGNKLESEHCFPQFCPILWTLGRENGLAGSINDLFFFATGVAKNYKE